MSYKAIVAAVCVMLLAASCSEADSIDIGSSPAARAPAVPVAAFVEQLDITITEVAAIRLDHPLVGDGAEADLAAVEATIGILGQLILPPPPDDVVLAPLFASFSVAMETWLTQWQAGATQLEDLEPGTDRHLVLADLEAATRPYDEVCSALADEVLRREAISIDCIATFVNAEPATLIGQVGPYQIILRSDGSHAFAQQSDRLLRIFDPERDLVRLHLRVEPQFAAIDGGLSAVDVVDNWPDDMERWLTDLGAVITASDDMTVAGHPTTWWEYAPGPDVEWGSDDGFPGSAIISLSGNASTETINLSPIETGRIYRIDATGARILAVVTGVSEADDIDPDVAAVLPTIASIDTWLSGIMATIEIS